eukprot:c42046_g1_i1 orf=2-202(+)
MLNVDLSHNVRKSLWIQRCNNIPFVSFDQHATKKTQRVDCETESSTNQTLEHMTIHTQLNSPPIDG